MTSQHDFQASLRILPLICIIFVKVYYKKCGYEKVHF